MSYPIATSLADVRDVIEPLVVSTWTGLGYAVDTIEWPNTYFQKPGNGPWIRVSYPQQSTTPLTWSGNGGVAQSTTIAILTIQIFVPRNAGDLLLITACSAFRATFERQTYGAGIKFTEGLGPNETLFEPQWAGRSLSFPFSFLEDIQQ